MNITELTEHARVTAQETIVRHKKLSSYNLYAVLAPCLEISERCLRDPNEQHELDALLSKKLEQEPGRCYVEHGSDVYTRICRYVFAESNRSNISRYAHALREAAKMQINSGELIKHLKKNGGINALYFRRPLTWRAVTTKALQLSKSITISRDEPFTVTLQWNNCNTFDVLKVVPEFKKDVEDE